MRGLETTHLCEQTAYSRTLRSDAVFYWRGMRTFHLRGPHGAVHVCRQVECRAPLRVPASRRGQGRQLARNLCMFCCRKPGVHDCHHPERSTGAKQKPATMQATRHRIQIERERQRIILQVGMLTNGRVGILERWLSSPVPLHRMMIKMKRERCQGGRTAPRARKLVTTASARDGEEKQGSLQKDPVVLLSITENAGV